MSYDLAKLAGRVQRLERDNRRLKLGTGALVAVLVAVPLVGAVLPAQVPETITARSFGVLDEQGTVRGWLEEDSLFFYDEQGPATLPRAEFNADGLRFFDEQGTARVGLLGDVGGMGTLAFVDEQGTARVGLDEDGLGFLDEQGTERLQLGRVTVVNQRTEAETTYPAALVLFDEAGNVIESLPR